jgi:hypothetical protein
MTAEDQDHEAEVIVMPGIVRDTSIDDMDDESSTPAKPDPTVLAEALERVQDGEEPEVVCADLGIVVDDLTELIDPDTKISPDDPALSVLIGESVRARRLIPILEERFHSTGDIDVIYAMNTLTTTLQGLFGDIDNMRPPEGIVRDFEEAVVSPLIRGMVSHTADFGKTLIDKHGADISTDVRAGLRELSEKMVALQTRASEDFSRLMGIAKDDDEDEEEVV